MTAQTAATGETETEARPSLGHDLRALRRSRGLTLSELALRLGRSVGYLSQMERGLSEPSIADLRKLAELYGVSLSFFFSNDAAPEQERRYIVREAARRRIGTREGGLVEELLSPDLGGSFEIVRSVFAAGAGLDEPIVRETEEAGFVVSGTLDLEIDGRWFTLDAGDSFRFAGQPYRWRNPGETDAVVVWVIAPPIY